MEYVTGERRSVMLVVVQVVGMLVSGTIAQAAWQIETVAPVAKTTSASALVFDGQDRAQIVFGNETGYLQHIHGNHGGATPGWTPSAMPPFQTSIYGQYVFLASSGNSVYLGSSGYGTSSSYRNYAAVYEGSAWTQPTNFPSNSTMILGVATDGAGQAHWLVSTGTTNADTGRGITTPGTWLLNSTSPTQAAVQVAPQVFSPFRSTTEGAMHTGGQTLFDSNGNLHSIQYYEGGSGGTLMYVKGPASGPFEVTDNIDPGWQVKMAPPSLALDGAGNPHIAYSQQWPDYGVKYLSWNGTGWDSEWVDQGGTITGYIGTFPDVIIDKAGQTHVFYADLLNGLLKHALRTGSGWQIETIDQVGTQIPTNGVMAGALAAAMDSRGGIGVAYWNAQAGQMKYAYLVPEPASLVLLIAAGGLMLRRRA
jgi:hypothetical protein